MKQDSKCIVIGLDGATWELLDPLMKAGKLPTLKKMIEGGAHGVLKSTIPPLTGPAWVSFATGKNPGKHGCFDFQLPRDSLHQIELISSKDIKGEAFYEVLDRHGKRCTLINLPCSYPPRIGGPVITDFLTRGSQFVFPESLTQEIPEFKQYRVVPKPHSNIRRYINDIRDLERVRFECAKKLFQRDWDFFFILFQATDWIQHKMYDRLLAGEEPEAIKLYEQLDGYIKWFVENAGEATILIMSDHGFHAYDKAFAINKWLMEQGYLKVKPTETKSSTFRETAQKSVKVPVFLLKHRGLLKFGTFLYTISQKVLPITPKITTTPNPASIAYSILSSANGDCCGIYINSKKRFRNGSVEAEDYERVRSELIAKLQKLTGKDGGRIFRSVLKREDVYSGECLNRAPDVFAISDGYNIRPFSEDDGGNEHSPDGIFIAYGEDIKKGVGINNAEIIDLAPTILHLMKTPIASDTDGKVLKEIFKEGSEPARSIIKYQAAGEREGMHTRIKGLKASGKI